MVQAQLLPAEVNRVNLNLALLQVVLELIRPLIIFELFAFLIRNVVDLRDLCLDELLGRVGLALVL